MTSRQFLRVGGGVLFLLGVLGFVHVLGPTPETSIFGTTWWSDTGESWGHLILGIIALIGVYVFDADAQKSLATVLGTILVLVGLYSIFNGNFLGVSLENPADTILHLILGIWALIATRGREEVA